MNCLSVNIRGAGGVHKADWIRELKIRHHINFLCVQETQLRNIEDIMFDRFWDFSEFDCVAIESQGRSGGLFCLWNSKWFHKVNVIHNPNFIIVSGKLEGYSGIINMVNVYAPVDDVDRCNLWGTLKNLRFTLSGCWLFLGDFNEVRFSYERFSNEGSQRCMDEFNNFIRDCRLSEFQLGGRKFTRMSDDGRSLSKLDRFIACDEFFHMWGRAIATILPLKFSDHSPILLIDDNRDFGPRPFRFFNSWLHLEGIDSVVRNAWSMSLPSGTADRRLLNKFKTVKGVLKNWRLALALKEKSDMLTLSSKIEDLEKLAEFRELTDQERSERQQGKKRILEIEASKRRDLRQKSRVKWNVDGDENSKFFHAFVNKNTRRNYLSGVHIGGAWVTDPVLISKEVFDFFSIKFSEPRRNRPKFISDGFNKISELDNDLLIKPFSEEEIKEAVWSCGSDKAPGPDGFTFNFCKKYWDLIKIDVIRFVKDFELSGSIANGCNSSFISLIPKTKNPLSLKEYRPINLVGCIYKILSKVLANRLSPSQTAYVEGRSILDGPLILNEIIAWAKARKRKLLIFKVDFEKAFDCLSWEFLNSVMEQMEFGWKWRRWIMSCLASGKASVLVNGSPSKEFDITRGVRQGDPLAPFLFIIAMEGLKVSVDKACELHFFRGVSIPSHGISLSHLMYADDVTFIGEWSEMNFINLNRLLRCFFLASGLCVNLCKSKVYGIGVENLEVIRLASILKCEPASLPFSYLGLPVGANMRLEKNWISIIEKFKNKLSAWKAKYLSFGGRLTLINSVLSSLPLYYFSLFKAPVKVINKLEAIRRRFLWGGSLDEKKVHWVAWDVVTKPKDYGGLGVCGLHLANLALLAKWWWRLKEEDDSFWARCIKAIHNLKLVDGKPIAKKSIKGVWLEISCLQIGFGNLGVDLPSLFNRVIGSGDKTRFWQDTWIGDLNLKERYPNLYSIEVVKDCFISDRLGRASNGFLSFKWCWKRQLRRGREESQYHDLCDVLNKVQLGSGKDRWLWMDGNHGSFSVQALRKFIISKSMTNSVCFKWTNWIPLKLNCFAWRLFQNRIPLLNNLSVRGIHVSSSLCICCGSAVECLDHVFFLCEFASALWRKISVWSGLFSPPPCSSRELLESSRSFKGNLRLTNLLLSIIYVTLWGIWKERNARLFRKERKSVVVIFDDLCLLLFNYVKDRSKLSRLDWPLWVISPVNCI